MARNNKRIKKKSVTDYSQGLAMTKESIKNVFEY